ncbi:YgaP family membrane protein [Thiobacillus sp.]
MKPNMGTADKIIRLVVVAIIAALYFTGQISGTVAIILGIVAVAFLLDQPHRLVSDLRAIRHFHPQDGQNAALAASHPTRAMRHNARHPHPTP